MLFCFFFPLFFTFLSFLLSFLPPLSLPSCFSSFFKILILFPLVSSSLLHLFSSLFVVALIFSFTYFLFLLSPAFHVFFFVSLPLVSYFFPLFVFFFRVSYFLALTVLVFSLSPLLFLFLFHLFFLSVSFSLPRLSSSLCYYRRPLILTCPLCGLHLTVLVLFSPSLRSVFFLCLVLLLSSVHSLPFYVLCMFFFFLSCLLHILFHIMSALLSYIYIFFHADIQLISVYSFLMVMDLGFYFYPNHMLHSPLSFQPSFVLSLCFDFSPFAWRLLFIWCSHSPLSVRFVSYSNNNNMASLCWPFLLTLSLLLYAFTAFVSSSVSPYSLPFNSRSSYP